MQYLGAGLTNGAGVDAFEMLDVDFMLAAIFQARTAAARVALVRGIADDFQDTTGIDATASTGEVRVTSGNKYYHSLTGVSLYPQNMTSDSAPSPQTAAASSAYNASYGAWKAHATGEAVPAYWAKLTNTPSYPEWNSRGIGEKKKILNYSVTSGAEGWPKTWLFQARADGGSWVTLDTRTNALSDVSATTGALTPSSPSTASFDEWRIYITDGEGYCSIASLAVTVADPDMSLITVAETAATAPSSSRILLLASAAAGAIVAGTNLRAWLSRNDGTNWTEATLTSLGTVGGQNILTGVADLTGQPSGTAPRARVDTFASGGADILIEAIAHKWAS